MSALRLQKYMSECGICSRRHAEEAIARGDVIVNGIVAQIGQSIDPEKDTIEYGGQMIKRSEERVYYAMNKPRGIETTCAQKGGESIVDIIDAPVRVFPIGRLDKDSSGLILLTNDGRITHRLLHPSFEHEKEYLVTVYGKITDVALQAIGSGVRYAVTEGPKTPLSQKLLPTAKRTPQKRTLWAQYVQTVPCEVRRVSSDTFLIVLTEGKNRQIRRMVEACGFQVKKLKRIRIEHIQLGEMPEGAYRELKRWEREELLRRACLPLVDFDPIVGTVIHGDNQGHTIGYPTANIAFSGWALPDEVFSCRVKLGEEVFLWAGTYNSQKKIKIEEWVVENGEEKHTVSGGAGIFEVYILNFDRDIYGQTLHIELMDSIRPNRPFASLEDLKVQIAKDVNHVSAHWKRILNKKSLPE